MPTARECVCCLEVPKVASKAGNRCITDHSDFFGGILNPVVLQIAYRMRAMELNDMELIGQRSTHKGKLRMTWRTACKCTTDTPRPWLGLTTKKPTTWSSSWKRKHGEWYYEILQSLAPETWDEWRTILRRDFAGEHVNDWAFLQLQEKRQQLGETSQQYVSSMLQLCAQVEPDMSEVNTVRYLLWGLRPEMMERVAMTNPQTPTKFHRVPAPP
ncbi:hypothetical protein HPB47_016959 [Ixodes persulcatus]|uniref:Uncharacterized protein n=1 Tax=Ixodes persulcatus TaxID=34615 RepID=A0AC60QRI1_IXOPE|nr:hypothetical protein HPB47_016959 [Ixodes persulcatus]